MKTFAIALLAIACLAAQAQDAKPSKEREALRRAQSALRAAQQQQSSLQAEKAQAESDLASAKKQAETSRARIAASEARLKAREAELEALRSQLQMAKDAQAREEAKAVQREQALQQQLQALRQEGSERMQANQALARLLERSTQALADAEAKNHQLYAIGQDLVQRYTRRSALDTALQQDPLLGLTAVRLEDQAEKLRAALDASKLR
jgi:chromosome segregation ATPase